MIEVRAEELAEIQRLMEDLGGILASDRLRLIAIDKLTLIDSNGDQLGEIKIDTGHIYWVPTGGTSSYAG